MANRLAKESSPYLRQHADNPVDWYPWGDEALKRAKAENKPILLSVGYSSCHWCHVMAHESFEDAEIARQMNECFINVKIDREERPDLDHLYQGVVQLLGRGGGWPLTVFLTPDLVPFYGGTYFPKHDKYGMPGFPQVLSALHTSWMERRPQVLEQAQFFHDGLKAYVADGLESREGRLEGGVLEKVATLLAHQIDPVHGGFGRTGPKFPNPMSLALILRGFRRCGKNELKAAVLLSLEKMAHGGVYDQLGGGFHRYSVDERWLVPHFEKMLYDNGLLLHLYAEAQQLEPSPLWEKTASETVGWLLREMTSPEGAFYAAQDADSEGEEGKFFVWSVEEIDALLPPEVALQFRSAFNVSAVGNFEHRRNVLEAVKPLTGLDEARKILLQARQKRIAPMRDDKVLAGWNGYMIRGLALASRVFVRPDWAKVASRCADFIMTRMRAPNGRLCRSWQGEGRLTGMIEDYGGMCSGLVALYQATFEVRFLEWAEQLADMAWELFWDEANSAYLTAPKGTNDLLMPTWALHDNAAPSGASTLCEAQVILHALTGHERHRERAERYLTRLATAISENPIAYSHLWVAADAIIDGAPQLTVMGTSPELIQWVNSRYIPSLAICNIEKDVPDVLKEQAAARTSGPTPAGYLCRERTCGLPAKTVDELKTQVGALAAPSFYA